VLAVESVNTALTIYDGLNGAGTIWAVKANAPEWSDQPEWRILNLDRTEVKPNCGLDGSACGATSSDTNVPLRWSGEKW